MIIHFDHDHFLRSFLILCCISFLFCLRVGPYKCLKIVKLTNQIDCGVWSPHWKSDFWLPLSHKIKFGKEGTDFDYIADGGQDNLFRYTRWEMNFRGHNKHNLRLLFQPFDVTTTQIAKEDLTFDYVVFPENTPVFSIWFRLLQRIVHLRYLSRRRS